MLAIAAMLLVGASRAQSDVKPPRIMDRTLVVAGRDLITERDLLPWLLEARLQERSLFAIPDELLLGEMLSEAVDELLLWRWAEQELGAPVPPADVADFTRTAWQRYERLAGSRRQLEEFIREAGLDTAAFGRFISQRTRANIAIRTALSLRTGSREEVRESIEEATRVRMAHIFLKPASSTDESHLRTLERALAIRREVISGFSFDRAAAIYSDDSTTAKKGGDLGWVELDTLDESLRRGVIDHATSPISRPILTAQGYHLIRVLDYETPRRRALFERFFIERKYELERLRKETDIHLASGFKLRDLGTLTVEELNESLASYTVEIEPLTEPDVPPEEADPALE